MVHIRRLNAVDFICYGVFHLFPPQAELSPVILLECLIVRYYAFSASNEIGLVGSYDSRGRCLAFLKVFELDRRRAAQCGVILTKTNE